MAYDWIRPYHEKWLLSGSLDPKRTLCTARTPWHAIPKQSQVSNRRQLQFPSTRSRFRAPSGTRYALQNNPKTTEWHWKTRSIIISRSILGKQLSDTVKLYCHPRHTFSRQAHRQLGASERARKSYGHMDAYEKNHFPQNSIKHATLKRRCQKKHDASKRIVKSTVYLHDIRTKRNRPQSLMALEWPMGPLKYLNVAFDQQQTTLNVLTMLPRTVQNAL